MPHDKHLHVKVSVVTAVFNDRAKIEPTILSALGQADREDIEYIVVDGGSSDGTMDVVNRYRDRIDIVVSERDDGYYDALNKGILAAHGEWIGVLNAGDTFAAPDTLHRVFASLGPAEGCDVAYGDAVAVDGCAEYEAASPDDVGALARHPCYRHGASFVRRSTHLKYLFDLTKKETLGFALDYEQIHRMFKAGVEFRKVPVCVVRYELRGVSTASPFLVTYRNYLITHGMRCGAVRKTALAALTLWNGAFAVLERAWRRSRARSHSAIAAAPVMGAARVFDCFTFLNELDLLEIRLNELNGVVDKFVVVEGVLAHSGRRKPLVFAENRERFAKFAGKIVHVVVGERDFAPALKCEDAQEQAWMRENIQRNAIERGLAAAGAEAADIVMVSDLDELPRAASVAAAVRSLRAGEVVGLALNAYNFYANLRNASVPVWRNDPKIATVGTFRDAATYKDMPGRHYIVAQANIGPTATKFRYVAARRRLSNAGWHFSYLGGIETIAEKVGSVVEGDWSRRIGRKELESVIAQRVRSGRALGDLVSGGGSDRFLPEDFDETFPAFLRANAQRFRHLIIDVPEGGRMKRRLLRGWHRVRAVARSCCMRTLFALTPVAVRKAVKRHLARNGQFMV